MSNDSSCNDDSLPNKESKTGNTLSKNYCEITTTVKQYLDHKASNLDTDIADSLDAVS